MDRVGELIVSNPSLVLNNDLLFFSLIKSFCGCNYKPEKWDKFEAMLLNHPALSKVRKVFWELLTGIVNSGNLTLCFSF